MYMYKFHNTFLFTSTIYFFLQISVKMRSIDCRNKEYYHDHKKPIEPCTTKFFINKHICKNTVSCQMQRKTRTTRVTFLDFFWNSGFSWILYFTRNEQISVPAFCRALNFENRTSITCLISKVLQKAGTEIYSFLVKYEL